MAGKLGISRSKLLAITDATEFVGAVIDDIWALPWPDKKGSDEYVAFFKTLPPEKRIIWATWRLQSEVANGGFGQYLANLEDECYLEETRNGLSLLGASEHLEMLELVLKYRDDHADEIARATSWNEYKEIMGVVALNEALDNITFRFIRKNPELYSLRRDYIMQHIDTFAPRRFGLFKFWFLGRQRTSR